MASFPGREGILGKEADFVISRKWRRARREDKLGEGRGGAAERANVICDAARWLSIVLTAGTVLRGCVGKQEGI